MRVDELLLLELGKSKVLGALDLSKAVLFETKTVRLKTLTSITDEKRTDSPQLHVKGVPMSHSVEG